MLAAGAAVANLDRMNQPAITGSEDDLFRLLVNRVKDYAIFGLDPSGIVVSWNAGAEHIKGYRAEEIIGHHFSRFYPEEAIRSGWPQTELARAKQDGRFEDEGWRIRKDGSRFWANVVITALYDDLGALRGFAKVTRDLTERKRVERLEADAQQMGEFVAMLAHELRNPLAPIRSAVNVAMHSAADEKKTQWALSVIDRQSSHLTKLVEDLLDVSRIASGRVRLERRRLRLSEIVDGAVDVLRVACEGNGQELQFQIEHDPVVRGDAVRLTQVISNLLNNACKYTPPGGRIEVTLDVREDRARLSVRDTGIGIPPDLLPRVFDLFTQDKRALDRSEGGLGLGLAISRRLVDMHGGTLSAHSAGRGCGSEFVLEIPAVAETEESVPPGQLHILVVEDNPDAAATLQALLEMNGHRCVVAADGEAGLEAARRLHPDVALLDIGLPKLNGYELARKLRNLPELDGISIAAITGYASAEDQQEAIEAGFDVHFSKPVNYDALLRWLPMLGPVAG